MVIEDIKKWLLMDILRRNTEILDEVPQDITNPVEIEGYLESLSKAIEDDSMIASIDEEIQTLNNKPDVYWKKEWEKHRRETKERNEKEMVKCLENRNRTDQLKHILSLLAVNSPTQNVNVWLLRFAQAEVGKMAYECDPKFVPYTNADKFKEGKITELNMEKKRIVDAQSTKRAKRQTNYVIYKDIREYIEKILI